MNHLPCFIDAWDLFIVIIFSVVPVFGFIVEHFVTLERCYINKIIIIIIVVVMCSAVRCHMMNQAEAGRPVLHFL